MEAWKEQRSKRQSREQRLRLTGKNDSGRIVTIGVADREINNVEIKSLAMNKTHTERWYDN